MAQVLSSPVGGQIRASIGRRGAGVLAWLRAIAVDCGLLAVVVIASGSFQVQHWWRVESAELVEHGSVECVAR